MANANQSAVPAAAEQANEKGIMDTLKGYAVPAGKALLAIGIVAGAGYAGYRYGCSQSAQASQATPTL